MMRFMESSATDARAKGRTKGMVYLTRAGSQAISQGSNASETEAEEEDSKEHAAIME